MFGNSLGLYTSSPNAIKTIHFNQSFLVFHTLPTPYDIEKCMHAFAKARRRGFWCITQPNVWQFIGRYTSPPNAMKTMHFNQCFSVFHLFTTRYDTEECMHAPVKVGNAPFGTLHGPACGGKEEHFISRLFCYQGPPTFSSGGAPGPYTVFTAAHTHGHVMVLLPRRVPPRLHHLQNKKWWCNTRMYLCGYVAQMCIPPIKR